MYDGVSVVYHGVSDLCIMECQICVSWSVSCVS